MEGLSLCLMVITIQVIILPIGFVDSEATQITMQNYEEYRSSKDFILLNFYADWCRFSQMLKPIFDKSADILHAETDKVLLGKVNCDADRDVCSGVFHISKYPTLKIVRFGMIARKEYRGQRTTDGITSFVRDQIKDPVEVITDINQLASKVMKRAIIGYFPNTNMSDGYINFVRVAINLRDECPFYSYFGDTTRDAQIVFREEGKPDALYTNSLEDATSMRGWIIEHCIPLVREITFQNGEEMTEEGLPLLILFYSPDDTSTKDLFKQRVEAELREHRGSVNCVTADGVMFAHPLHHLGKHKKDLPVLAIDSFRHMYVFPNFQDIHVPGKIHDFISDLHSGKLHKDFHNPPPPTQQEPNSQTQGEQRRSVPQSPPESTFKKLAPARSRYSFRDEL